MISQTTGEILGSLHMIGHPSSPIYLLDGPAPLIVDAGLSLMGETYLSEIRRILGNRAPSFLFLTHAHFDHCGSAGILKKAFPGLVIGASPLARDILGRPGAVNLISELNRAAFSQSKTLGVLEPPFSEFQPFDIQMTLKEGDTIPLSGHKALRVLETPGHTRDSLTFFIPEEEMVLCGEALGIPDHTGYIIPECLSSFPQYVASMEKLSRLSPRTVCIGHYHVFTGADAAGYIRESLSQCEAFKTLVHSWFIDQKMDLADGMARLKKIEYDGKRESAQPEAAYFLNLKARIAAVLAAA